MKLRYAGQGMDGVYLVMLLLVMMAAFFGPTLVGVFIRYECVQMPLTYINPRYAWIQIPIFAVVCSVLLLLPVLFGSALYLRKHKTLIMAQDDAAGQAPAP
jgi:hypothetical protein